MNSNITIIDYGLGNTLSICQALLYLGYRNIKISHDPLIISQSALLILPGVGAFKEAMTNIKLRQLQEPLNREVVYKKTPILGICLGMQLFGDVSYENGLTQGLAWIPGTIERIEAPSLAVPHVGWNNIKIQKEAPLFLHQKNSPNFYFDHTYHFKCPRAYISSTCHYGTEIVSSIQKENIIGVQFHPEKSQTNGLRLFKNTLNYLLSDD